MTAADGTRTECVDTANEHYVVIYRPDGKKISEKRLVKKKGDFLAHMEETNHAPAYYMTPTAMEPTQ